MVDNINETHQYLTFKLAEEKYALGITQVREVLDYTNVTHVPRMPAFLKGVINLRGNVVPVIDLRLCLGLSDIKRTVDTCIVIVELMMDGESLAAGMLTDSVQEVVDIDPTQIKPAAQLGNKLPVEYIKGMGLHDEGFVIIIDIDRVISDQDLSMLQFAGSNDQLVLAA